MREDSRQRIRETVEDVVYVVQTIKKFNREGAENLEQIRIPEFVPRDVEVDIVNLVCDTCGAVDSARENEVTINQPVKNA